MMQRVVAVLLVLAGTLLYGQDEGVQYEKVLVPILIEQPLPGGFGSLWATTFWVTNNSDRAVSIYRYDYDCHIPSCPSNPPTPPRISFRPVLSAVPELPGIFLFIEETASMDIEFSLRVRDLSRQSQTWGTEIPVVRENAFRAERIDLLDIPVTPEFRYMVRIYGLEPALGRRARVRVFALDPASRNPIDGTRGPDLLLGETFLDLATISPGSPVDLFPGYAQLSDFSAFANLSGVTSVRLEIDPIPPLEKFWAFVSVTNNETQHLTVVTPQ